MRAIAEPTVYAVGHLPPGAVARDIGPETRARFAEVLGRSRTGLLERAARPGRGPAVCGRDPRGAGAARGGPRVSRAPPAGTPRAIAHDLGVAGSFQFISTGGGAALEFVQGIELPGLAVLPDE